ncbi:MAG: hypothetical protein MUO76_11100 [Anaerolineaceae bacterium]|nr:hypothetical protein [Anaerolineaceae bacterium]
MIDNENIDVGGRLVSHGQVDIYDHGTICYFVRKGAEDVHEISNWMLSSNAASWMAAADNLVNFPAIHSCPSSPAYQHQKGGNL